MCLSSQEWPYAHQLLSLAKGQAFLLSPALASGSGLVLTPGPCPWTVPFTFPTSVCASGKWASGPTHRTYCKGQWIVLRGFDC